MGQCYGVLAAGQGQAIATLYNAPVFTSAGFRFVNVGSVMLEPRGILKDGKIVRWDVTRPE